jgi:hypothetical protein
MQPAPPYGTEETNLTRRTAHPRTGHRNAPRGWLRFLAWSATGACLALGISAIGLFTVPAGLLFAVGLTTTLRTGRELLGLLAGVGAVSVFVGAISLHYRACPKGPVVLAPGQGSFSCGGFDGTPWLIAGLAVTALAAALYWRIGRRRRPEQPDSPRQAP